MYHHERIQKQKDIVTKWEKCLSKEEHEIIKGMDPDDLQDLLCEHFGIKKYWVS